MRSCSNSKRILGATAVAITLTVGAGAGVAPAWGQPAAQAPAASTAPVGADAQAAPYASPLRTQCEAELGKDKKWHAELRAVLEGDLAYAWHDRESRAFLKNKQHVIAAYAVLWVLVAGFAAVVLLRQRRLSAEIARLREDIARAAGA
jgi:hypothetical protein